MLPWVALIFPLWLCLECTEIVKNIHCHTLEYTMTTNLPEEYFAHNERLSALQDCMSTLQIFNIATHVQQSPHAGNGHVAIYKTHVKTPCITVSMDGVATPDTSNSEKAHVLLQDAALTSLHLALSCLEKQTVSASKAHTPPHRPQAVQSAREPASDSNRGASLKQKEWIVNLAKKQGKSPDAFVQEMAGKPLAQCSTVDASNIIKRSKVKLDDSVPF